MADPIKKQQSGEIPPPPPPITGFQQGAQAKESTTEPPKVTDSSIFKKEIEGLGSQEAAIDKSKEFMKQDVSGSVFADLEATVERSEESIAEQDELNRLLYRQNFDTLA